VKWTRSTCFFWVSQIYRQNSTNVEITHDYISYKEDDYLDNNEEIFNQNVWTTRIILKEHWSIVIIKGNYVSLYSSNVNVQRSSCRCCPDENYLERFCSSVCDREPSVHNAASHAAATPTIHCKHPGVYASRNIILLCIFQQLTGQGCSMLTSCLFTYSQNWHWSNA